MLAPSAPPRTAPLRLFAAMLAAGLMVSAATPVFAGTPANAIVRTTTVAFNDLDLTTDTGAATLEKRIKRATKQVCGTVDGGDLAAWVDMQNCRSKAMASAMPKAERAIAYARANGGQLADSMQIRGTR